MPNLHRAAAPPRPNNLPLRISGDRANGRSTDQAGDSGSSRSCRAASPIPSAPTWEDLLGQR